LKVVVDTSALSRIMHFRREALSHLARVKPGEVFLPSPVAAEIAFGLERLEPGSRRRVVLEREYGRFRELVRWADWDEPSATIFGQIKADLVGRGLVIEDIDLAIASIARCLDATLATCNYRHFSRIDGLRVEDWDSP
jgi:tRNA(fMet)-specific endonuclease VapC